MLKIIIIELLIMAALMPPLVCGEVVIRYLEEPSSQNLTCDPYGGTLRLHCTIIEPTSLKIASKLLLLWNWTPVGGKPGNDSCLIYPYYQCEQYVAKDKYDFSYEIFEDPSNSSVSLRRVNLVIQNVGQQDEGCYNCRPLYNSSPLPFEQSSDLFCLQPVTYYKQFQPCRSDTMGDNHTIRGQQLIPSKVSETISTSAITMLNSTICEQFRMMPATLNTTNDMHDPSVPYLAITVGLCAGLCLIILIQTIIIIYQCYWRQKKYYSTNDSVENNVKRQVSESCINSESSLCQTRHSQHFIGTYSYIKPFGTDEYLNNELKDNIKSDIEQDQDINDGRQVTEVPPKNDKTMKDEDAKSPRVSILSPGVHIYQTLDKYLEQLMNTPLEPRDDREAKQLQITSPQQLFDDPNYSPVEISDKQSPSSTNHFTLSSCTLPGNYDKLQPKSPDAEYAYAYSHIMKLRKQLKKLRRKDGHTDPSSLFHLELLHVAATGTYEIDPKLITQIEDDSRTTTRKSFHDLKEIKAKPQAKEERSLANTTQHLYQSLNENTMNVNSGYAHLVK